MNDSLNELRSYILSLAPKAQFVVRDDNKISSRMTVFHEDTFCAKFDVSAYHGSQGFYGIYFDDISEDVFENCDYSTKDVIRFIINGQCKRIYYYDKKFNIVKTITSILDHNLVVHESVNQFNSFDWISNQQDEIRRITFYQKYTAR